MGREWHELNCPDVQKPHYLCEEGRTPQPVKKTRIRTNVNRDEWLYDQYLNHPEKTIREIRAEVKARNKRWKFLNSDQAAVQAIQRHCKSLGIPMPARRQE